MRAAANVHTDTIQNKNILHNMELQYTLLLYATLAEFLT